MFVDSRRNDFTIVPILVGSLNPDKEQLYGQLLAPYLADPDNLFVISSDFCHWGKRIILVVRFNQQPVEDQLLKTVNVQSFFAVTLTAFKS